MEMKYCRCGLIKQYEIGRIVTTGSWKVCIMGEKLHVGLQGVFSTEMNFSFHLSMVFSKCPCVYTEESVTLGNVAS